MNALADNPRLGLIVPFYNHGQFSQRLVAGLLPFGLPIIIIDDGSEKCHRELLQSAVASLGDTDNITLKHLEKNSGKGGAVIVGFELAEQLGLTHVIQIDADCQHDFDQIPAMSAVCKQHPTAVICGYPEYDDSVPKSRLYPRYITHFWVWVNTLSFAIKDALCGFRCYPLASTLALCRRVNIGQRMDFDIDMAVRLVWSGLTVINLPIKVIYHVDKSSHFRLWADNVLISRMHARLFFGMLWRLPHLLARHFG